MLKLRFWMIALMASFVMGQAVPAMAFQEEEVEVVVESIEEMADEISGEVEEIGKAIEQWVEGHEEDIEKWVEAHASQWEAWAEKFEEQMQQWAEGQEKIWKEWSEEYSKNWEKWESQLEGDEFDSEQIGELIERNVEMLGEIPLGQMIDGLMKNGSDHLQKAPWDSIEDLQEMIQSSVEKSIQQAEKKAQVVQKIKLKEMKDGEAVEQEIEFILPLVDKLNESMAKRKVAMKGVSAKRLKDLEKKLMNAEGMDEADIKKLVEQLIKAKKSARVEKGKEESNEAVRQKIKLVERTKAEADKRRAEIERKIAEALSRSAEKKESGKDQVKKVYEQLKKEKIKIDTKATELDKMRAEIAKLRKEIKRLKEKKKDDE